MSVDHRHTDPVGARELCPACIRDERDALRSWAKEAVRVVKVFMADRKSYPQPVQDLADALLASAKKLGLDK